MNKKSKDINIAIITFIALILVSFFFLRNSDSPSVSKPSEEKKTTEYDKADFNIYYFNVGQGDSTLITIDDMVILIDAGNIGYGNKIAKFLRQENIDTINYLIGTHPDADHVGGLDEIINHLHVDNLYLPTSIYECSTKQCSEIMDITIEKNIPIEQKPKGYRINLNNDAYCVILSDMYAKQSNVNDTSVVLECNYKDTGFLFLGDAPVKIEKQLLSSLQKIEVLKVAHHGADTSTSMEFLNQIQPDFAIISVGKNSYSHPKQTIIDRLTNMGIKILRTDEQGTIILTSDGNPKNIKFNFYKNIFAE